MPILRFRNCAIREYSMGKLKDDMVQFCHQMRVEKQNRLAHCAQLKKQQHDRQSETQQWLQEQHKARLDRQRDALRQRQHERNSYVTLNANLRAAEQHRKVEFHQSFGNAAAIRAQERREFLHNINTSITDLLGNSRKTRLDQTRALAADRIAYRQELSQATSDRRQTIATIAKECKQLQHSVQIMRNQNRKDLAALAATGREERRTAIAALRQQVIALQHEADQRRGETAADLAAIRMAWNGQLPISPPAEATIPQPATVPQPADVNITVAKTADATPDDLTTDDLTTDDLTTDDLTTLRGIGSQRAQQLKAGGINTFTDLVNTPKEQIAEILGERVRPEIGSLIKQAMECIHR